MDESPIIQNIHFLSHSSLQVDSLRLDQIHPIVSGNKWYKLRFYISEAKAKQASTIASFGGPYSNHLVALAYAAKTNGLASIGYVRSNQGEPTTPSLKEAIAYGMQIEYLGRTQFQEKKHALLNKGNGKDGIYFIDEGGYGLLGAKGAATIITDWEIENKNKLKLYDYIICAVGTGTMIAGIINAAGTNQKIIGIPVLKNEVTIRKEIQNLLLNPNADFELLHSFHEGGYAKNTPALLYFMNQLWDKNLIPTDFVYTGKVFFAVQQLIKMEYFKSNSSLLIIHSGGLQGNRSLYEEILHY